MRLLPLAVTNRVVGASGVGAGGLATTGTERAGDGGAPGAVGAPVGGFVRGDAGGDVPEADDGGSAVGANEVEGRAVTWCVRLSPKSALIGRMKAITGFAAL